MYRQNDVSDGGRDSEREQMRKPDKRRKLIHSVLQAWTALLFIVFVSIPGDLPAFVQARTIQQPDSFSIGLYEESDEAAVRPKQERL